MAKRSDNQSMRGFLEMAEQNYPSEVMRMGETVSRELDINTIVFEFERAGRSPIFIFDHIKGFNHPIITNLAANRQLLAAAMEVEPDSLPDTYRERCQNHLPVELLNSAPWQEVVMEDDNVDLTQLPIPLHFAVDAAPYITAGLVIARDPESGVDTAGFHRLMLKGRNRLGISLHSRRRMYEFHRRAEARGESLAAAIAIGIHPIHIMGSMAYHYPSNVRKFEIMGGLFGEPCKLAPCRIGNIAAPAEAEIVIEGEILHTVREPEGPFGEYTGYASHRSTENVFVAKRIQMRRDYIFHSIVPGLSRDHLLIGCISREAEILNTLRRNLPNVRAVHVPTSTTGFMAIISMQKTAEGQPKQAIMAAMATEFYIKLVVVVDEDINIFNLSEVMWALITRTRADKDLVFIPNAMGAALDPTSDRETYTLTKVGVDATKPAGRDFAERLIISDEQRQQVAHLLERCGISI